MAPKSISTERVAYVMYVHTRDVDGDVTIRVGAAELKDGDFAYRHLMQSAAVDRHSGRIPHVDAPRASYTLTIIILTH